MADAARRLATVAAGAGIHVLILCAPAAALTGWGGLVADARLGLFLALGTAWCVLESLAQPSLRTAARASGLTPWLPVAIGSSLLVCFWISLADRAWSGLRPFDALGMVGAAAMLAGIGMRLLAIRTLGRYFLDEISLVSGQPLITTGIYGWLRHPSEAGTIALAAGGACLLGSAAGLVICVVGLVPLVLHRIQLEDTLLARRHPTEFAAYAHSVPALMPRVRRPAMRGRHGVAIDRVDHRPPRRLRGF